MHVNSVQLYSGRIYYLQRRNVTIAMRGCKRAISQNLGQPIKLPDGYSKLSYRTAPCQGHKTYCETLASHGITSAQVSPLRLISIPTKRETILSYQL